jgi:hypothetical protein
VISNTFIEPVLNWFQYFRADIELHFRIQTTQFYQGALMITAAPTVMNTVNPYCTVNPVARSWLGPKYISAQTQDTLVLHLPWLLPQRFALTTALQDPALIVPWEVYVDIIAPLRSSSPNAADTITVQMMARFVNPQCVFPTNEYTTMRKQQQQALRPRVVPQSSGITLPTIGKPRGNAMIVGKNKHKSDPVSQAMSGVQASSTSSMGTITNTIADVASSISSVTDMIQPLMEIAALFDKPNIPEEATRVVQMPATNYTNADVRDQAYTLSLYKTAYLGTAPGLLPDSDNWTFPRLAQVPSLGYTFPISNTSPTVVVPVIAAGSPFIFSIGMHQFYRGSARIRLNFFTSTFVSGRILLQLVTPTDATLTPFLNNTVARVIDVKGDTTVQFTVPFIWETDLKPTNNTSGLTGIPTAYLLISVYNPLVASDASVDAFIDLVTWQSAASDCQFALPGQRTDVFAWPNSPSVVPQCDIRSEFENTFDPFVAGCTELTDQKFVNAEYSDSILDTMKRYQLCSTNWANTEPLPLDFSPHPSTLSSTLASLFLFHRGGVSYRAQNNGADLNGTVMNYAFRTSPSAFAAEALGQPFINVCQQDFESNFSLPWYCNVPYVIRNGSPAATGNYQSTGQGAYITQYGPVNVASQSVVHTCVRDDYAMGFLIPPFPPGGSSASAPKKRQDRKVLSDSGLPRN